ncbi:hypothetical protein GCM10010220_60990 [Streptomyces parvulus]|nr:hypothetical protein GCM10010220_60990 [Streptomyces parvulus]
MASPWAWEPSVAEAMPTPAAISPPATIVTAAAFFRFFTYKPSLRSPRQSPRHALENARAARRMRHTGDIPTTV